MKFAIATVAALAIAGPACAQTIVLKPLLEARLRGETARQVRLADDSDAVTIRVRAGASITRGRLTALVEAQGNLTLAGDYYDGLHGAATRPVIGDPENVALYRAQLQYSAPHLTVTAGRQRIALDDERFVGAAGFRQNGQTFDAVRAEWTGIPKLRADVSYVWGVRTIWGVEGAGARPQSVPGDTVLANLSYTTPIGTLTGFAYLVDQDAAAVQAFRLSSQTYGARFTGVRPIGRAKFSYQLSYARQQEFGRNPNSYTADYALAEGGIELAPFRLTAGYEVLGADQGVALTSFQTPIGTLFKFNGWADKFLTTPPDGLRDLYGTATLTARGRVGPFTALSFQASYHRFESDRLVRHYGDEVGLLLTGKIGRYTVSVRYADYDADLFATNTRKGWIQLDWAF